MKRFTEFLGAILSGPRLQRENERLRKLLVHQNIRPPSKGTAADVETAIRDALDRELPVGIEVESVSILSTDDVGRVTPHVELRDKRGRFWIVMSLVGMVGAVLPWAAGSHLAANDLIIMSLLCLVLSYLAPATRKGS